MPFLNVCTDGFWKEKEKPIAAKKRESRFPPVTLLLLRMEGEIKQKKVF